jgi:phospholipase D1/2
MQMFHPSANRLAGFLEVSALSIALAQSGGAQFKAGYLRLEASGSKGAGIGRRGAGWREKRRPKWCAVRESYLVIVEDPGEVRDRADRGRPVLTYPQTEIWDVVLLDADFRIERPTRYFRQGVNLLHPDIEATLDEAVDRVVGGGVGGSGGGTDGGQPRRSIAGTIRSGFSKVLHPGKHHAGRRAHSADPDHRALHEAGVREDGEDSSSSESEDGEHHDDVAPMADPSTVVNPLVDEGGRNVLSNAAARADRHDGKSRKKGGTGEVSKHTFYIENSQKRLKLYARNEVRAVLRMGEGAGS